MAFSANVGAFSSKAGRDDSGSNSSCTAADAAAVPARTRYSCNFPGFEEARNRLTGARTEFFGQDGALLVGQAADSRGGERQQYQYEAEGYNYRMTEMAGALGIGQLSRLDGWNARRRHNASRLTAGLEDLAWLACPVEPDGCVHAYHQYTVRVPQGRDALRRHLEAEGIGTRVYYPAPIHTTPYYRGRYGGSRCPEAVRAAEQVLSLPVHPSVGEADLERIVNAVRRFRPGS